jgi:hypothetical protein
VLLKGSVAATPSAGATSFQLAVDKANRGGKLLEGKTVTLNVDAKTVYVKGRQKVGLDALAADDPALVLAQACRNEAKEATPAALPQLTARLVVVRGTKNQREKSR